ncbi:MAG: gliding motility-associated C-terminal domain-containing protein [Chitinophagaceae bacterium]
MPKPFSPSLKITRLFFTRALAVLLLCFSLNAFSQTYVFASLQGTPVNTSGWNLSGSAFVGNITGTNNGELILSPSQTQQSGAIFYNQPINLSLCNKWVAEFDFRIFDGTSADGMAFCFLDIPPSSFVNGQGLGIPANANGLKVCFDTYPNCSNPDPALYPKITIRYGVGYNECAPQPTADNNGSLNFLRSSTYNHAKINYNAGNIDVYVNNTLYLSGFQQFNFAGYLGFTAATGSRVDNHSIKNVTIYTDMPPSKAGDDLVLCPGQTIQIGTASNPGYAYSWTPAGSLSSTSISNPVFTAKNTGTSDLVQKFSVSTSFTASAQGCASTDSIKITIKKPAPLVTVSSSLCSGQLFTLPSGRRVPVPGSYIDTLRGNTGCDSLISSVQLLVRSAARSTLTASICAGQKYTLPSGHVVSTGGVYEDTIRSVQGGCDSMIVTVTLDTNFKPATSVSKSNDISCVLGSSRLTATGGKSYEWSPAASLSNATVANPLASPATTTVYHVKVFSGDACFAEDSIRVEVSTNQVANSFNLPNAFSPNGDGSNDCFGAGNWGSVTGFSLSVYNRAGNLIFHTTNPHDCWDGTYKGFPQPTGTYVYKASANTICGPLNRSGSLLLLR